MDWVHYLEFKLSASNVAAKVWWLHSLTLRDRAALSRGTLVNGCERSDIPSAKDLAELQRLMQIFNLLSVVRRRTARKIPFSLKGTGFF